MSDAIGKATVQPWSTMDGWVWCGLPGHFVGGSRCRMHLNTRVADFRISTIGEYFPRPNDDAPTEIGLGRLYETYVFSVEGFGEHGEGDVISWFEIDSETYMWRGDAERGHMVMCLKYDAIARRELAHLTPTLHEGG